MGGADARRLKRERRSIIEGEVEGTGECKVVKLENTDRPRTDLATISTDAAGVCMPLQSLDDEDER